VTLIWNKAGPKAETFTELPPDEARQAVADGWAEENNGHTDGFSRAVLGPHREAEAYYAGAVRTGRHGYKRRDMVAGDPPAPAPPMISPEDPGNAGVPIEPNPRDMPSTPPTRPPEQEGDDPAAPPSTGAAFARPERRPKRRSGGE
jgi:hypothetical protein